jgi:hypothetical protein
MNSHLRLVSDFPRLDPAPVTMRSDFVTLLEGWQILLMLGGLMMISVSLGVVGTWLLFRQSE